MLATCCRSGLQAAAALIRPAAAAACQLLRQARTSAAEAGAGAGGRQSTSAGGGGGGGSGGGGHPHTWGERRAALESELATLDLEMEDLAERLDVLQVRLPTVRACFAPRQARAPPGSCFCRLSADADNSTCLDLLPHLCSGARRRWRRRKSASSGAAPARCPSLPPIERVPALTRPTCHAVRVARLPQRWPWPPTSGCPQHACVFIPRREEQRIFSEEWLLEQQQAQLEERRGQLLAALRRWGGSTTAAVPPPAQHPQHEQQQQEQAGASAAAACGGGEADDEGGAAAGGAGASQHGGRSGAAGAGAGGGTRAAGRAGGSPHVVQVRRGPRGVPSRCSGCGGGFRRCCCCSPPALAPGLPAGPQGMSASVCLRPASQPASQPAGQCLSYTAARHEQERLAIRSRLCVNTCACR